MNVNVTIQADGLDATKAEFQALDNLTLADVIAAVGRGFRPLAQGQMSFDTKSAVEQPAQPATLETKPSWYEHTLHDECGVAISTIVAKGEGSAFGKPGVDYDKLFTVSAEPLFKKASAETHSDPLSAVCGDTPGAVIVNAWSHEGGAQ